MDAFQTPKLSIPSRTVCSIMSLIRLKKPICTHINSIQLWGTWRLGYMWFRHSAVWFPHKHSSVICIRCIFVHIDVTNVGFVLDLCHFHTFVVSRCWKSVGERAAALPPPRVAALGAFGSAPRPLSGPRCPRTLKIHWNNTWRPVFHMTWLMTIRSVHFLYGICITQCIKLYC